MRQKKLKVIRNEYAGTNRWRLDPTTTDEEIELFNRFLNEIGAVDLIWNREKKQSELQIVT